MRKKKEKLQPNNNFLLASRNSIKIKKFKNKRRMWKGKKKMFDQHFICHVIYNLVVSTASYTTVRLCYWLRKQEAEIERRIGVKKKKNTKPKRIESQQQDRNFGRDSVRRLIR
jgi:hypothetical protein